MGSEAGLVLRKLAEDRLALAGLLIVLALLAAAIFAPWLATHPEAITEFNPAHRLRPPGGVYWFGTDRLGADIYSRLLFGARITIVIALVAVGVAVLVGVPLGLIAGIRDGVVSSIIMRLADIFLAVPQIVLAIAIAQTLGPSIPNVILALSATFWPWFTRLVYAETRAVRNETFIEATLALGASPARVVWLHVLPNIISPIIVRITLGLGFTIPVSYTHLTLPTNREV